MMASPAALLWLGANLVFALLHPALRFAWPVMPTVALSVGVNSVLFVLPGLGWTMASAGSRWPGTRAVRTVLISVFAFLAVLVVARALNVSGSPAFIWNALWLVTNAGFVRRLLNRPSPRDRRTWPATGAVLGVAMFVAGYGAFYWGATRVVPAQGDHDLEVMATGYGLIDRFEPLLLTDRGGVYFFAHPPLLHFAVGGSFLLHGRIAELAFYEAATRAVKDARERNDPDASSIEREQLRQIFARYIERPFRVEARTPNVFFGALAVTLLGLWAARIARRWWFGVLIAAAFATSPEVFVRSSYGGYFAIGTFACMAILLAAERWRRWPGWRRAVALALATIFAALADHKLIVVPAAFVVDDVVRRWRAGTLRGWRIHPAAVGFAVGLLAFWAWGLAIAPAEFIRDHFQDHLVDRITHTNPLGYVGYPSASAVWIEFLQHTGFLVAPLGIGFLVMELWRQRVSIDVAMPSRGAWLAWILLAGVAFTLIDWRMTKHFAPLMVPIVLGLVPERRAPNWRVVVPAIALLATLAFNLWTLAGLVQNFDSLRVTPQW